MNTIAEHKTSSLIIQVEQMTDKDFIGRVLVGNSCNPVGTYSTWSTANFNISNNESKKDPIVQQVVDKFQERSKIGIEKYKTTLAENKLSIDEWINHAIEEQMDNILYLTKLREELRKVKSIL